MIEKRSEKKEKMTIRRKHQEKKKLHESRDGKQDQKQGRGRRVLRKWGSTWFKTNGGCGVIVP